MPGHRQPSSLESLSLQRVCRLLDSTCRKLQVLSQESSAAQVLSFAKEQFRPYYAQALTARLRSQVIEKTSRMLYEPSSDGSTLISGPAPLYLLALLLGHDIRRLKVNLCCYYGCSHQTSLLKLLASEGAGLESLELARSALLRLDCKLLKSALFNMRNLRKLVLRNIASDPVLQVVGRACPKLLVLDVACSRQVTDVGLKQLLLQVELKDRRPPRSAHPGSESESESGGSWSKLRAFLAKLKTRAGRGSKNHQSSTRSSTSTSSCDFDDQVLLDHCENRNALCDTLRVLNVANTGVTSAGVLLALIHLARLESLAEYNHMGRVVETMNRGNVVVDDFVKRSFNLTQARSCRTTPNRLELLAEACPRLERMHISEPLHPPEALRLFPHVTALSVHGIPVRKEWLEGFYAYLKCNGEKLRELDMRVDQSEIPLDIDLREILASCPNLRTISKDGSNVVWLNSAGPDPPTLKHLKRVQLGRTVSAVTITKLLHLCPELTALHVHSCFDLTNEQLEKLLGEPSSSSSSSSCKYYSQQQPSRDSSYNCVDSTLVPVPNSLVRNLECFYIYEACRVSASTVLNMFKNCDRLRRIGNLANWGLDCEGVRTLRSTFAKANLDVDLCNGAHWFWSDCI